MNAENITSGGKTRQMIVYAPQNLGENRPLLISMHGYNQDMGYQRSQANYEAVADTAKFVVVYPDGEGRAWDTGGDKDINFIVDIINAMYTRYKIDKTRVYLSGFSMGGMMTYHAMTKIADKIAAFAPVSGYNMGGPNTNSSRPIPIIHVHGTGDDVCTYSPVQSHLDAWVKRNKCNTTPVTIKPQSGPANTGAELIRYLNGENGVEVAHLKLPGKGHWHSNDPVVAMTNIEIWNFCRRWTLNGPLDARENVFKSAVPENGSFDMDSEKHRDFTINFKKIINYTSVTAKLLNARGTAVATMAPNETRNKSALTFTLPEGLTLANGSYKLQIKDYKTSTGLAGQDISINYTYGVEELDETSHVDTLLCQDWYAMKEELGEGVPSGWIRTNTRSDGKDEQKNGAANVSGSRMKYFITGGDFDAGFYLSARDYDNVTMQYGKYSGKRLTLKKTDYLLSFDAIYWNSGASDGKSTFSVSLDKSDGSVSALSEGALQPTGCLGEDANQQVRGSKHFELPVTVPSSGYYYLNFGMSAGWNAIIFSSPLLTTVPSPALRYKYPFLKALAQAQQALDVLQQMGVTGTDADALAQAVATYQDFTSISPTEYLSATEALKAALNPALAVGISLPTADLSTSSTAVYYDLTGRKLSAPKSHGIYIKRGRKVVVSR